MVNEHTFTIVKPDEITFHIATLVRKADEFLFLEGEPSGSASYSLTLTFWVEITPWVEPNPPAKRKPKIYEHKESGPQGVTMMDQFVSAKDATEAEETPDYGQEALVNEDGTMQMEW